MPMPVVKTQRRKTATKEAVEFNYVLTCGNMIQIFTPDRMDEMRTEVQRLVEWGNPIEGIEIGLLESDDPFG